MWCHQELTAAAYDKHKGVAPPVATPCSQGLPPPSPRRPAHHPHRAGPALGTCVGAREGAEELRVRVVAVMHLHHVVEGRVEEGKLSKHHCGGDTVQRAQGQGWAAVLGGSPGQLEEQGDLRGGCRFMGLTDC